MVKSTSYNKDGHYFETYKFKKRGDVYILVKRDGKPFQTIRLGELARFKKPSEW